MAKYYFLNNAEKCYTIDFFKNYMRDSDLKELELFEAKKEENIDFFFCKHFEEIGEKHDFCGKMCNKYEPKNGRSGCCKYNGSLYEKTDKKITLKLK